MNRSRGKRHDDFRARKLNMKKVVATIIAIIVIIMIIISLKNLLTQEKVNKNVSSLTTYIPVIENNKWGVIDNNGNIIIGIDYDEMIIIPDNTKDLFICNYDVNYSDETYKTKILNKDGIEILNQYQNIEPLENNDGNNIWYEKDSLKFKKDGKFGLIDFEGEILLDPIYDNIYTLKGIENSVIIEKDGKKGLVNPSTGQVIIEPKYIEISSLLKTYENGYIVKNENNKYGLIAADKTILLEEKYDEIKNVTGNNNYYVVENGVQEIINQFGTVVINSGFESVKEIQLDKYIITINNKYGVIDNKGTTLIPAEYEDLTFATANTLIAKKDGKYGIINQDGSLAVDFKYERMSYLKVADFFQAEKSDNTTDIINGNLQTVLESVIISVF